MKKYIAQLFVSDMLEDDDGGWDWDTEYFTVKASSLKEAKIKIEEYICSDIFDLKNVEIEKIKQIKII